MTALAVIDSELTKRDDDAPNRVRLRVFREALLERRQEAAIETEIAEEIRNRPRNRGECPVERPCPWVRCRYHLLLRVQENGSILFNRGDYRRTETPPPKDQLGVIHPVEEKSRTLNASKVPGGRKAVREQIDWAVERLFELEDTCALDFAERGEHTWDEVAAALSVHKERVRQVGEEANEELRDGLRRFREGE